MYSMFFDGRISLIKYKVVFFIAIVNLFFTLQALCYESWFYGLSSVFLHYGSGGYWGDAELREKNSFSHGVMFLAENETFISLPLSPADGSPPSPWTAMDKEPEGAEGGLTPAGIGVNPGGSPSGGGGDGGGQGGQGDGGDNPWYPGEEIDFSEEEPSSLFSRLNELMEQFDGQLVLLVDLEGTLFDSSVVDSQREMRARFKEFVEKWRQEGKLRVVVVTRREMNNISFLIENNLPEPDVLISMYGGINSFHIISDSPWEGFSELMNGIYEIEDARYKLEDRHLSFHSWYGFIMTYFTPEAICKALNQHSIGFLSDSLSTHNDGRVHTISVKLDEDFGSVEGASLPRLEDVARQAGGFLVRYEVAKESDICTFSISDSKQHVVSQLAGVMGLNEASQPTGEVGLGRIRVIAGGDTRDDIDMMAGSESYHVEERIYVRSEQNNFDPNLIPANSRGTVLANFLSQLVGVLKRMVEGQNQASGGQ